MWVEAEEQPLGQEARGFQPGEGLESEEMTAESNNTESCV